MPLRVKSETELRKLLRIPEPETPAQPPYVAPPMIPRLTPRQLRGTSSGFLYFLFLALGFVIGFAFGLKAVV